MNKPNKIYYEKPNHTKSNDKQETLEFAPQEQIEQEYYKPSYQQVNYHSTSSARKPSEGKIKAWIANGVLIVLSVFFVILFFVAVTEMKDYNRVWSNDEDSFWYYITDGDYPSVVRAYYNNKYSGVKETIELKECYAVAEYFEAASLYKVAVRMNNQAGIEKYSEIMQESLGYMEDFLYVAEDINEKLGIE